MATTDTSWIVEGAKVALVTYAVATPANRPTSVKVVTVERFTTTQVVLDDGTKLRRDDLNVAGDSRTWRTNWTHAMHPGDPRVADARASIYTRRFASGMPKLFETVHDLPTAVEVIVEVERQIAELRAKIGA